MSKSTAAGSGAAIDHLSGHQDASGGITRVEFLRRAGLLAAGPGAAGLVARGLVGAASAAAATPKRGGTLQIATDQMFEGDSLDPIKNINDGQAICQGMIREPLSLVGPNQIPAPWLATWESNSAFTKWTLKLRTGVKFHSGKPLTAQDAAYSIARFIDPKLGSELVARLGPSLDPSDMHAVDATTLELKLKRPDSLIMGPLGRIPITPAGDTNFADGDGTGPFVLKSWVAGVSCQVARNPSYWRPGEPYLDAINMLQISEGSTKTESVLAGPSDITEIDYQSLPLVKGRSGIKQLLGHEFHMLNVVMVQTSHPWNDARVREAFKRSIDRQKLVQIAFAGYGTVAADTPVPTDDVQFPHALLARTKQDLDTAHSLMREAGYKNGMHVVLPCSSDTLHATFALAFAQAVSGSPFTVTVQQHPGSTYWSKIYLNVPTFVSDWNRRSALEATAEMLAGSSDEPHFNNPQVTSDMTKGFATTGAAQTAVVQPMLTTISETSGDIIPAYRHRIFLAKSTVQGVVLNPYNLYLMGGAWLA
jgi:peptide/nickel transport system substrate-binding protein